MSKICKRCKIEKDLSDFHNHRNKPDGKAIYCIPCNRSMMKRKTPEQQKKYDLNSRLRHPEKRKQIWANYYAKNKERLLEKNKTANMSPERLAKVRAYSKKYAPIQLEKQRQRRKNLTPEQKMARIVRNRFAKAVIRAKKGVKWCLTSELSGCTIVELRQHIEKQFLPGMNWGNHGNGHGKWNIDHIVPLAKFDMTKKEEQLKAFHYSNLRPLWFMDNMARCRRNYKEPI